MDTCSSSYFILPLRHHLKCFFFRLKPREISEWCQVVRSLKISSNNLSFICRNLFALIGVNHFWNPRRYLSEVCSQLKLHDKVLIKISKLLKKKFSRRRHSSQTMPKQELQKHESNRIKIYDQHLEQHHAIDVQNRGIFHFLFSTSSFWLFPKQQPKQNVHICLWNYLFFFYCTFEKAANKQKRNKGAPML